MDRDTSDGFHFVNLVLKDLMYISNLLWVISENY